MQLIDNHNRLFGDDLKATLAPGARLKIAASCFSMFAYEALKKELEKIEELQFIFTAPTFVAEKATEKVADKIRKERREFVIPKLNRERSLYGSEFEIRLRNQLTQRAIAKECADWIRRKVAFRSNKTHAPMQQFACVTKEGAERLVYMPINGFTAVDLGYQPGNAVSSLITKLDEAPITQTFLDTFNQIWNDDEKLEDVTVEICDQIATVYQENSPESIYFLMLYNIFNEFLDDISEDVLPNDRTGYQNTIIWKKLFNFQKDAATGIINKLETFNGCILADSVGLGKTFTALAVIKYYELRNKSVLVLCPKKLVENWTNYNHNYKTNIFKEDRFNYDVLCHTDLDRDRGHSGDMDLSRVNWGNYDLLVIDESHNFRNNIAFKEHETRYQKLMRKILRAGVKTKVLMLSATPVNNRFNDLRNQLALAYEGNSETLREKLHVSRSIEEIFRRAQETFNEWSKKPPEERTAKAILEALDFDFFELLDSVTIARSRKHIQTYYDTKDIGQFPKRLPPKSYRCQLTPRDDVMKLDEIFKAINQIKQAVYAPMNYLLASKVEKYQSQYDTRVGKKGTFHQTDREKNLQLLMTINLLKRLESSVEAFRITLKKLESYIRTTLDKVEKFQAGEKVEVSDLTSEITSADPDDDLPEDMEDAHVGGKVKIDLNDMDVTSWARELNSDLEIIRELLSSMNKITPDEDSKLQHLKSLIRRKIENPINPGNRKILLFTAFADTAQYLYQNLAQDLKKSGIDSALVTGSGSPKSTLARTFNFQELLTLFSPRSKEKAELMPDVEGEIDLLIGTDCISEGQNLQDCDFLVNYDIHWNPVRIIQRFGRIDRIGSPNQTIQLVNYWPDIQLDEYIDLKERVENRMVLVDVTATGDDNVLTAKANDLAYRKKQLEKLQNEVIDLEDLKTGVSITDLGLNDFRMDLLDFIKEHDLSKAPNGLHAVLEANPEIGLKPGVIFVLRNRNEDIGAKSQNRLHPYYLVDIGMDGEILHSHTDIKHLLDLARNACKGKAEPLKAPCKAFNAETRDGKDMNRYSELLTKAIDSIIHVQDENNMAGFLSGEPVDFIGGKIGGLDDFELICFFIAR
jgi:SNF2 family DNA or RNA helicase